MYNGSNINFCLVLNQNVGLNLILTPIIFKEDRVYGGAYLVSKLSESAQ